MVPSSLNVLSVAMFAATAVARGSPSVVDPAFFSKPQSREKLVWVDCYGKYKCARLKVGLEMQATAADIRI